jgi:CDP-diacylglycerol--glycerol-3-phosphate 3-phosphatidyltransferase
MVLLIQDHHVVAMVVFVFGAISDWLDGFVARRLKQTSRFGAFLDPVADKLLVVSVTVLLVWEIHSIWFTVPAVIIICREVIIVALREWMASIGNRVSSKVAVHGKVKSIVQFIALSLFILVSGWDTFYPLLLAYILLYLATAMTIISMGLYLSASWSRLDWEGKKR